MKGSHLESAAATVLIYPHQNNAVSIAIHKSNKSFRFQKIAAMPRCSLLFVLALAVTGAVNGHDGKKTPSQAFLPRKVLSIRGGAGPLDVVQTAKFATVIGSVNSGIVWLSPKKCEEIYDAKFTPTSTMIMKRVGAT